MLLPSHPFTDSSLCTFSGSPPPALFSSAYRRQGKLKLVRRRSSLLTLAQFGQWFHPRIWWWFSRVHRYIALLLRGVGPVYLAPELPPSHRYSPNLPRQQVVRHPSPAVLKSSEVQHTGLSSRGRALKLTLDSVFEELLLAVVSVAHPDGGEINYTSTYSPIRLRTCAAPLKVSAVLDSDLGTGT